MLWFALGAVIGDMEMKKINALFRNRTDLICCTCVPLSGCTFASTDYSKFIFGNCQSGNYYYSRLVPDNNWFWALGPAMDLHLFS